MAYRVTNEDGLRMRGTRVANYGAVIDEDYYRAHAEEYGWKDSVERVNKAALKQEAKSNTDGSDKAAEPEVKTIGQSVKPMTPPSEAGTADVSEGK